MADFTLTNVARYPNGTEVKAYPESNWTNSMVKTDAAPLGSATSTKTMTDGTLTFTGLTVGDRYVAHAEVGGEHRYLNFIAVEDLTAYRGLIDGTARARASDITGAAVYAVQTTGTTATQDTANLVPALIYFDPAKFAVPGRTTKLRLVAACAVNDTAPAITLTFGLYPVTNLTGVIAVANPNFGTVVTGSTIAFATPAANSESAEQATSDINLPAEGWYGIGMSASGAMAANSVALFPFRLELRNVVA